ncbi:FHA domain-containing protein [Actinomadura sp. KC216]|nr:FHA domain-containing protein [Actinomadura sp. KC216]
MRKPQGKVDILPEEIGSLATGLPPAEPGTLFVKGSNGGMRVSPDARFNVVFGRCAPDVHVCVGGDDTRVSRQHGIITREHSRWVLYNLGKLAIRFPGSRLVLGGHRAELPVMYTPLFIVSPGQEHLLEVRIAAGRASSGPIDVHELATYDPEDPDAERANAERALTERANPWRLSDQERLVLVCLAQRYLRQEPWPQPLTWAQVADEIGRLRPAENWNWRKAARVVTEVRNRLSPHVGGLREEEIPPPIGNALNHNLIVALLVHTRLRTQDLALIDG